MGSENGFPDELPVHKVTLPDYYIDIYEVTNALYRHCVDAGGCKPPHSESGRFWDSAYNSYPVTYLEWEMAKGYCSWRGARLPTEAEWEKAARGGLNSEPFPWGSARPVCQTGATEGVNYAECNQGSPLAVGSFAPNAFGLYDMSGNVWEWVADWYSENYYTARDVTSPSGPRSGAMRVIRGGSFNYGEIYIRVSNRGYLDPESYGSSGLGLRCARLP
jgi:formylglycine-generating enzyme required for sulfatase activity